MTSMTSSIKETTSRRELLRGVLGAGALAVLGRGNGFADEGEKKIRVGLGALSGSAARGAELGIEEARHTARLLGMALEIGADSDALVRIGERAPDPRGLFLALEPAPASVGQPGVFHVGSSAAFRERALAGRDRQAVQAVDWHPGLERFGAEQLNQRFVRRFETPMDEAAWRGWMAVKVAAELALRGHLGSDGDAGDARAALAAMSFDGHKGRPLAFDAGDRHLVQPVYLIDREGRLLEEIVP
jgi:hypothetical protein